MKKCNYIVIKRYPTCHNGPTHLPILSLLICSVFFPMSVASESDVHLLKSYSKMILTAGGSDNNIV